MKYEFGMKELLESLAYDDLLRLRYDIANDASYLQQLVNTQIARIEHTPKKVCAACTQSIDSTQDSVQTLLFGPTDFKKKASFCSQDCLELFLFKLRKQTQIHA